MPPRLEIAQEMAAENASASSFTLHPPPLSDIVERIKYPGRIVHIDRALATLGGSSELSKQFSKNSGADATKSSTPVQLSLRLGLASSQPGASDRTGMTVLTSECSASRGFLLCVTLDDSGCASDAVITASYERSHSFCRLADLVYRRDEPSAASHIVTPGVISGAAPSIAQLEAMGPFKLPIPHRFCLMDTPLASPTLFQKPDAKVAEYMAAKHQAEFQSVRPKCYSIDQRSDATPSNPPVALNELDLTAAENEIHAKLVEMFAHQPIWTRRGICRSLSLNSKTYGCSPQFLRLLGSVSYRFQDGAFHNSYIRLGYDPRQIPSQSDDRTLPAWNQPIPIRISSAVWRIFLNRSVQIAASSVHDSVAAAADDVRAQNMGSSEVLNTDAFHAASESSSSGQKPWLHPSSQDALLSPPMSRSFSIIPVQVRHPLFEEWKSSAQLSAVYDCDKGWFTSESLDSMRDVVERALHGMLTVDELRSLAVIEKEHELAADGRKGRHYTSVKRCLSKVRQMRRRTQQYGRDRIKELAALAPVVGAAADSVAVNESRHQQPASSTAAPSKASNIKSNEKKHFAADGSAINSPFKFEPSSQMSRPDIMSQLSNISNLAVIATQESGSDYDVFSGSSSSSSDDDSSSSSGSEV